MDRLKEQFSFQFWFPEKRYVVTAKLCPGPGGSARAAVEGALPGRPHHKSLPFPCAPKGDSAIADCPAHASPMLLRPATRGGTSCHVQSPAGETEAEG